MQTDSVSASLTTAAHLTNRQIVTSASLIVVDDPRLRAFGTAGSGGLVMGSGPSSASVTLLAGGALTAGSYFYTITAASGGSQSSACASTSALITAGGNLSGSVSWSAVAGASVYNIYRSGSAGRYWGYTKCASTTATQFTDSGCSASPGTPPPPIPYDFDEVYSGSLFSRVRTLSNDQLEIVAAASAIPIVWGSNLVTQTAKAGFGVASVAYGNNVDHFWVSNDGNSIKGIRSVDAGSSYGSASTIIITGSQPFNSTIRLAAPASNILFWTDSASGNTVIKYSVFTGGAWSASQQWDLRQMNLGLTSPLPIPGTSNPFFSSLDAIELAANDYLLVFYASKPITRTSLGIWALRVSNVTATNAIWRQLQPIYLVSSTNRTAPGMSGATFYFAFPKIMKVGSEYWIMALEISAFAGTNTVHLCYFRSSDGVHWSDREWMAGTDLQYGGTNFALSDLIYDKINVNGNTTFLFSYDRVFSASSTSLVGQTNYAMQLDLTPNVPKWSLQLPEAGQSATGHIDLHNPALVYNGSNILVQGARLIRKVGYVVSSGSAVTQLATEWIDEIVTRSSFAMNRLEITTVDAIGKMVKWISDTFWEYASNFQVTLGPTSFNSSNTPITAVGGFSDLTALSNFHGGYFVDKGQLCPGLLDVNNPAPDNFAIIQLGARTGDGFLEQRFYYTGSSFAGTYNGIGFQAQDPQNYYGVTFNRTASVFDLVKAAPASQGSIPNIAYTTLVSSAACTINSGCPYWLRVQKYHNHVQAFYSADDATTGSGRKLWKKVIDDTANVPADEGYWGHIGKGNLTSALTIGQTNQITGPNSVDTWVPLNDINLLSPVNTGSRMNYIERITANSNGILRGLSVLLSRSSDCPLSLPDTSISLCIDDGTGSRPANLGITSNVLFTATIGPMSIPIQQAITPWTNLPATGSVSITAGCSYWIWIRPQTTLSQESINARNPPIAIGFFTSGCGQYPSKYLYTDNASDPSPGWISIDDLNSPAQTFNGPVALNSSLNLAMSAALNTSGPIITAMNFASAETQKTIEYVGRDIAAKAGILSATVDSLFKDSGSALEVGADGSASSWASNYVGTVAATSGSLRIHNSTSTNWAVMRSNTGVGTFGDLVAETDLILSTSTMEAGLGLRLNGTPGSSLTGYYMTFVPANGGSPDWCNFYAIAASGGSPMKLYSSPALVPIPTASPFHVTVTNKAGYYAAWVQDVLVSSFFDTSIINDGSIGIVAFGNSSSASAAGFGNLNLVDLIKTKQYFSIDKNQSAKVAMDKLIGRDRIRYFARFDGTLRLASWLIRTVQDTFQTTIREATKTESDRYVVTDVEPQGDYSARRYGSTAAIDAHGRRYKNEDYTDAFTDAQAWRDGNIPLREAMEKTSQYQITHPAVPAIEREDRVTIINSGSTGDGTSNDYIVNDYTIDFEGGAKPKANMILSLRKWISNG